MPQVFTRVSSFHMVEVETSLVPVLWLILWQLSVYMYSLEFSQVSTGALWTDICVVLSHSSCCCFPEVWFLFSGIQCFVWAPRPAPLFRKLRPAKASDWGSAVVLSLRSGIDAALATCSLSHVYCMFPGLTAACGGRARPVTALHCGWAWLVTPSYGFYFIAER